MKTKLQTLSLADARALVLSSQGLNSDNGFGTGKKGAMAAISRLSYVQIDTISVVERAHHHVIWSRVKDYRPPDLQVLQSSHRQIFEYWSHAASYLPLRDYRFSLPMKKAYADRRSRWFRSNKKLMTFVRERIAAEGPLQAKDFEAPRGHKSSGWFDWKPAKIALEQLFMSGELMIAARNGFQKVYDLTERVVPSGVDLRFPTSDELARHRIMNVIQSYGVATEQEIQYQRKGYREDVRRALRDLEDEGKISRVYLEKSGNLEHYVATGAFDSFATSRRTESERVWILSPFDNLVIQRKRLKKIFGFDYLIECYTPEAKRKFGYFCLPVLFGERIIGRIDAKADRASKVLHVNRLFLENQSEQQFDFGCSAFQNELQQFAEFNGCSDVLIGTIHDVE